MAANSSYGKTNMQSISFDTYVIFIFARYIRYKNLQITIMCYVLYVYVHTIFIKEVMKRMWKMLPSCECSCKAAIINLLSFFTLWVFVSMGLKH